MPVISVNWNRFWENLNIIAIRTNGAFNLYKKSSVQCKISCEDLQISDNDVWKERMHLAQAICTQIYAFHARFHFSIATNKINSKLSWLKIIEFGYVHFLAQLNCSFSVLKSRNWNLIFKILLLKCIAIGHRAMYRTSRKIKVIKTVLDTVYYKQNIYRKLFNSSSYLPIRCVHYPIKDAKRILRTGNFIN